MIAKLISRSHVEALHANPRARPRFNLHESYDEPVQKMLVMIRQGEERPPHSNARELTQIILTGAAELLIYDDAGNQLESHLVAPHENFAYTLPPDTWHTKKVLTPFVVFVEVMKGPYVPGDVKEMV